MEAPRPGWRSPLPYILLKERTFFPSPALMDNIHPTAANICAHTHVHARAANVTTLASLLPLAGLQAASCLGYFGLLNTQKHIGMPAHMRGHDGRQK